MNTFIFGILATLATVCFHSWANILDQYFSAKIFNRLPVLIFFSAAVNVLFLPLVCLIDPPAFLSLPSVAVIVLISLINVFYHYPYYWALRSADTSIVTSLFSLGKIFTPIFAYIAVHEHLKNSQYAGFFLIIIASVLLTLDFKKLHFNKEMLFMFFVSVFLTIEVVLYKFLFEHSVSWGSSAFWVVLADLCITSLFMLNAMNYQEMKSSWLGLSKLRTLFVGKQFMSWAGDVATLGAVYFIPVSLFEGIESTQPIFVLVFAMLFAKKYPHLFNEYLGREGLIKKILLFLLMIAGSALIIL